MKKILTVLLATMMLFSLVGCGEKKQETSNPEEVKQENDTVAVDEGLLTATINLPNSFFESFDTTAEAYVEKMQADSTEEELFKEVVLNDDGSVTLKMSKSKYNKMMDEMAKSINDSIQEMISDTETYSNFADIKTNSDFTEFNITLANGQVSLVESFSVIAFYMYGGIYQMFTENPNMDIKVNFYDTAGNLIDTSTYDQNNNLN